MKTKIALAFGCSILAVAVVVATQSPAKTQPETRHYKLGIYTPTLNFGTSAARLQYAQGLAKTIEKAIGSDVEARAFTSFSSLKRADVDFAILTAQCFATQKYTALATAKIGGGTSRSWALFARSAKSIPDLRGQKIAFAETGCRDKDFIANAMLESEVELKYFGRLVGKNDIAGAVAEVASHKGADAVFAPIGDEKGLNRIFATSRVPNPAFVVVSSDVDETTVSKVRQAVIGYGGSGVIQGWAAPATSDYDSLRSSMGKRTKTGVFAVPVPVRVDSSDVLIEPPSLEETAMPEIQQHFSEPAREME